MFKSKPFNSLILLSNIPVFVLKAVVKVFKSIGTLDCGILDCRPFPVLSKVKPFLSPACVICW